MKGMVLAAGLGTRMRPLSYELPKPVVPVLGRPLCTYAMEWLHRAGVSSFVLNLHTHPKLIQQKVAGWAGRRVPVSYAVEPVILGTGGGIRNARPFLDGGTFVTANGDTIVRFPFRAALSWHRERGALATLVLFPDPSRRYTPVWIDGEGRITGFGDEPGAGTRSGFYTGCQIAEPDLFNHIPPSGPSCIIRETVRPLVARGAPVFGFLASGSFREFGSPGDYLAATLGLLAERQASGSLPPADVPGAAVVPPSWVAPGARIGSGATVGPEAVAEEGASVGDGARVSRCILWPGASVRPGETVASAIVTPSRRVPA